MMKLLRKLLLFILPAVIIAFVTIISITIYQTNELAKDNAQKIAQSSGESYAGKIESELDYSMDVTKSLASSLKSMVKNNEANRTVVDHMLQQLLEENERFVATWTAWEPNAFDGLDEQFIGKVGHDATGRYVPYWSRVGNDISVTALIDYEVEGAGDYYLLAKKTKQEVILEPYFYQIGNEQVLITSIVVPIIIDDQFLGVAGVDITLDTLQLLNSEVKLYESGFSSIVSNAGVIVAAANKELINEKLAEKAEYEQMNNILASIQQGKSLIVEDFSTILKKDAYIALSPIEVGDSKTPWSLIVTVPIDEVMAAAKSQMWTLIVMSVIGIVVLIVVIVVLASRLVKPIIASVEQVKQIAAGDLQVEPLAVTSNDEIGELAVAMNEMTDNTRKLIQEAADISHQVSAYSEQLTTSTNEISVSIDQVLTTTSELATGATVQAEHATSTLSVTQEVGRKVEEIKAYIAEMIHRSQQTEQSSREGMTHAEASIQGMHSMSQTVHKTANVVNELADKSAEINRILQVIDDIAAQTNLLALNAAIEAARAGEHGKGFAVVADEVRKLAEESAKSTSQISGIIDTVVRESQLAGQSMNGVVQEVEASASFIDANKRALDEIMSNIVSVVQQIELVTKASELIDQETQEVVRAVENITAISEESSAGSEELLATMQEQSASVTEINGMAKHLATMAESLQQSLAKFKY